MNGEIGSSQLAVSREDRRIAPSLLEDFGGVVDEEELVFARWFRAAQKFLPFREALIDEVFGRIGAIKDDPEIDAVLVLLVLGVGEQKNEGEKGDEPEWAPKLEPGPEPTCKEQGSEEEEPFWRFEGQTDDLFWRLGARWRLEGDSGGLEFGGGIFFVARALFCEIPGQEQRAENEEDPETPEVIFARVSFDGLASEVCDEIFRFAISEICLASVGKVTAGIEEEFISLRDPEESRVGRGAKIAGVGDGDRFGIEDLPFGVVAM